jgi:hypothetical protein
MYRNFFANSQDVLLTLMKLNLLEHSFATISKVYSAAIEKVKQSIIRIADKAQDAQEITNEFFVDSSKITEEFMPEFLAYFLFEKYDEEKIKELLVSKLNWKKPSDDKLMGHYDCAIHDASDYIYEKLNDVRQLETDVAVMIRFGAINKEAGQEIIKINEAPAINTERSLDTLCDLIDLSREDLENTISTLKQARVSKMSEYGR